MSQQNNLSDSQKTSLTARLTDVLTTLHKRNFRKALVVISSITEKCRLDQKSYNHAMMKKNNPKKLHPIRPVRGEIYFTHIFEDNVGKELNGNHLCVIISNKKKNLYTEKVNVVPIEGDGEKIIPKVSVQLTNDDLVEGKLDKEPSRVIAADVMTIDKARLDRRIGKLSDEKYKEIIEIALAQFEVIE